jgi:hypothetical protein
MFNLRNSLLVGASVSAFAMIAAPAFAQSAATEAETVIVTGTRVQGMTAADSAAPITVLGTDALTHGTGSADLRQPDGSLLLGPAIWRRHRELDAVRVAARSFSQ